MILYSFFTIPSFMAAAFVIILVSIKRDEYVPIVALTGAIMATGFALISIPQVLEASPITMQMEEWVAPYGITIFGDYLSVFLTNVVAFMGLLVILFSYSYVKSRRTKYYALISLLFAGILGVIHSGDLFNLFVFMELFSIASYGLIAFDKDSRGLEASIKYLIMGSLGTSFYLLGTVFIYGLTGSLNIANVSELLNGMSNPALSVAFGFILTGLGIKAGLVPFHALHIDGYTAAPSPVSAVLAALVTNIGLYVILRIGFIVFSSPAIFLDILLVLGTVSMIVGGIAALRQSNLKRLLAYSGISQVGYIAMSIGLGTSLGLVGGLFHMVNQAVIKGMLFLCAGAIFYLAGTVDLEKLSGALRSDRTLSYSFLIGMLALAGVPLFSGFASKWIIYIATYEVNPLLTVLSVVISAITLAYGLKAYSIIFSGNPGKAPNKTLPIGMRLPLIILSIVIIIMGVLPWIGINMSEMMASSLESAAYISGVHI
jgi:multicomponent Na+:H+ antiporter subunit D